MDDQTTVIQSWLGTGSINVFGRPFAGKDTQCNALAEMMGGVVVSSGDVLRHDHGNAQIQRIMAEGGIIPSELFEQVVVPYLARAEFANTPLILSEVGRADGEQHMIMRATEQAGHPLKAVILLGLSDTEVFNRFDAAQEQNDRGDRADDKRDVLQTRLNAYESMVTPVISYYRDNGYLIEVDGSQSKEAVTQSIIDALAARAA